MIASKERIQPALRGQQTAESHISTNARVRIFQITKVVLLAIAAALYAMHFVHLRADFPNHSQWMDWAKYTDEGWYGLAAIRHYQLGHWYVPGDFNPAAALPVWPLLELAVFRFTGVSLVAARALSVLVFGLILLCCYLLLRRWAAGADRAHLFRASGTAMSPAPLIAVLLLAASPYYFVFSRLAILEPLMVLLALAALIVAQRAGAAGVAAWSGEAPGLGQEHRSARAIAWCIALGMVVVLAVLTKTTALFLVPAIAWSLGAGCAWRLRVVLRAGAISAVAGSAGWAAYMLLFVRPKYMLDYRYLFSANAYTGIAAATFWPVVTDTLFACEYLGVAFFYLGLAAAVVLLLSLAARRFRGDGLTVPLLLWLFFYLAFLAYHDNLQPRYYEAIGVPLAMLSAMGLDRLWRLAVEQPTAARNPIQRRALQALCGAGMLLAAFTVCRGVWQTTHFVRHPQYTFVTAVSGIHDAIERQRAQERAAGVAVHPEMVLSISGADISLMTGLPSICDDFGTMTLPDRIAAYAPGWFVAWNDVEDDKMEALAPAYRLVRAGAWPAFDDPERNLMILYRLDPIASPGKGSVRRRRTMKVPRRLVTSVGEQPTLRQLKH